MVFPTTRESKSTQLRGLALEDIPCISMCFPPSLQQLYLRDSYFSNNPLSLSPSLSLSLSLSLSDIGVTPMPCDILNGAMWFSARSSWLQPRLFIPEKLQILFPAHQTWSSLISLSKINNNPFSFVFQNKQTKALFKERSINEFSS